MVAQLAPLLATPAAPVAVPLVLAIGAGWGLKKIWDYLNSQPAPITIEKAEAAPAASNSGKDSDPQDKGSAPEEADPAAQWISEFTLDLILQVYGPFAKPALLQNLHQLIRRKLISGVSIVALDAEGRSHDILVVEFNYKTYSLHIKENGDAIAKRSMNVSLAEHASSVPGTIREFAHDFHIHRGVQRIRAFLFYDCPLKTAEALKSGFACGLNTDAERELFKAAREQRDKVLAAGSGSGGWSGDDRDVGPHGEDDIEGSVDEYAEIRGVMIRPPLFGGGLKAYYGIIIDE